MTNPTTPQTLAEFWELSDRGKAEWWSRRIVPTQDGGWGYSSGYDSVFHITPPDALDIIRGNAERWLLDEGWEIHKRSGPKPDLYFKSHGEHRASFTNKFSLADALRTEMGRGGSQETGVDPA